MAQDMKPAPGYRVVAAKDSATVYIYGPIGASWWSEDGVTANQVRKDLAALGAVKTIDVRINSEGGDVFDGQAIYTLLNQHPATVNIFVDGLAASAASFIAMAGNTITVSEGGFIMIHPASGGAFGRAADLRKTADLLEQVNESITSIYASRTGNSAEDIRAWMEAETWMDGSEAVKRGFADKIVPNLKVAASVRDPSKYRQLPAALRPNRVRALALLGR